MNNISPYLTPGPDAFVTKRQQPLCSVPEIRCGNKPSDGGNLILTDEEKTAFLALEPGSKKYMRRFTGSEEFINGNMRWCLWLEGADPGALRDLPLVMERVAKVKAFRAKSSALPTQKAASTPSLFFYRSQPKTRYILIPEVSSERRDYIPIGFIEPKIISANTNFLVPSCDLYLFGILTSTMHMAWVRLVGGRLESRYRYSGSMVYNTFPWPRLGSGAYPDGEAYGRMSVRETSLDFLMTQHDDYVYNASSPKRPKKSTQVLSAGDKKKAAVEKKAQAVLDVREKYPFSTLADLYDPLTMPADLVKAHAELDRAVDQCYRSAPFTSDRQRIEFLFSLYEQYTSPLLPMEKKCRKSDKATRV